MTNLFVFCLVCVLPCRPGCRHRCQCLSGGVGAATPEPCINVIFSQQSMTNLFVNCLVSVLLADLAAVTAATAELVAQVQAHQAAALTQSSASN
jgi:hypothetical protein